MNDFYFLRNSKNKFFVLNVENYLNGLKFEYLMLDTGCNTILLPIINIEILKSLKKYFPKGKWLITSSKGVGSENYNLNFYSNNQWDFIIGKNNNNIYLLNTNRLRFHLVYEDIKWLLSKNTNILLNEKLLNLLRNRNICKYGFDILKNKRKKHVLIGQMLIENKILIQHDDVIIINEKHNSNEDMLKIYQKLNKYNSLKIIIEDNNKLKEFNDLEDVDNDCENYIIKQKDDYYDEILQNN